MPMRLFSQKLCMPITDEFRVILARVGFPTANVYWSLRGNDERVSFYGEVNIKLYLAYTTKFGYITNAPTELYCYLGAYIHSSTYGKKVTVYKTMVHEFPYGVIEDFTAELEANVTSMAFSLERVGYVRLNKLSNEQLDNICDYKGQYYVYD